MASYRRLIESLFPEKKHREAVFRTNAEKDVFRLK
jgi:hypothetical protein